MRILSFDIGTAGQNLVGPKTSRETRSLEVSSDSNLLEKRIYES